MLNVLSKYNCYVSMSVAKINCSRVPNENGGKLLTLVSKNEVVNDFGTNGTWKDGHGCNNDLSTSLLLTN